MFVLLILDIVLIDILFDLIFVKEYELGDFEFCMFCILKICFFNLNLFLFDFFFFEILLR